jgi:hypothetical protein
MIVLDPAIAKVVDEKGFTIAARALRREAHSDLRRAVLREGLKRFPRSEELREVAEEDGGGRSRTGM